MIGKDETVRFLNVSLYQGLPVKKGVQTIVSLPPQALESSLLTPFDNRRLWLLPRTLCCKTRTSEIRPCSAQHTNEIDSTCSPVPIQSKSRLNAPVTLVANWRHTSRLAGTKKENEMSTTRNQLETKCPSQHPQSLNQVLSVDAQSFTRRKETCSSIYSQISLRKRSRISLVCRERIITTMSFSIELFPNS